MVKVLFDSKFEKEVKKISDNLIKIKVKKQIKRILSNPEIGKPMKYQRKGTREVYVKPYRISYEIIDDMIVFLDIYHKDLQ